MKASSTSAWSRTQWSTGLEGPPSTGVRMTRSKACSIARTCRSAAECGLICAAAVTRFRADHAIWLERDALFAALWWSTAARRSARGPCSIDACGRVISNRRPAPTRSRSSPRGTSRRSLAMRSASTSRTRSTRASARPARASASRSTATCRSATPTPTSWAHAAVFLTDYVMGAPPSRTNPEGQPWGYPVLDPAQYGWRRARARCSRAWIRRSPSTTACASIIRTASCARGSIAQAARDPAAAVREGARLFESPDLPDHPRSRRVRDRDRPNSSTAARPRHDDGWVRELDDEQCRRYAVLFDGRRRGRAPAGRARDDLSCEVLSTMPAAARARAPRATGSAGWRVTQKANLDDPSDVYRTRERRSRGLGHARQPRHRADLCADPRLVRRHARRSESRHLTARLASPPAFARSLQTSDGRLATAMLAELFASRAENVSIFFADLFGIEERFNAPGPCRPPTGRCACRRTSRRCTPTGSRGKMRSISAARSRSRSMHMGRARVSLRGCEASDVVQLPTASPTAARREGQARRASAGARRDAGPHALAHPMPREARRRRGAPSARATQRTTAGSAVARAGPGRPRKAAAVGVRVLTTARR